MGEGTQSVNECLTYVESAYIGATVAVLWAQCKHTEKKNTATGEGAQMLESLGR